MGTLDGRVALISGGTGALGRVVSAAFLAAGAHVIVTYLVDAELPGFDAAVPKGRRETAKVELTSRADVEALVARIVATHGRIDVPSGGILRASGKREQSRVRVTRPLPSTRGSSPAMARHRHK